jgi:1-acyl-sn-glycerol-3-phosphate acyltransferase
MTALRVAWKLFALTVFTGSRIFLLLGARMIAPLFPRAHVRLEDRIARNWGRIAARILGVHVSCSGPLPQPPFLLVSNHLSYLDVLVYMGLLNARLLSKAEVKHWPIFGFLARLGGTLFVDRARRSDVPRVVAEIRKRLEAGRAVVFFPESTSGAGIEVMPFKASLFAVAAQGDFEVHTASLRYVSPPGHPPAQWSICWWGEMPFLPHLLRLTRLPRIEAQVRFETTTLRGNDRKQLAMAAEEAVRASFEPVSTELGPAPDPRIEALAYGTEDNG